VILSAPTLLTLEHDLAPFDCDLAELNEWLERRALRNQEAGAPRTYVTTKANAVVGYYALAAGCIDMTAAPGRFRRNMPNPIPIVLLGRLAVDRTCQGKGLGRALVRDAAKRIIHAAGTLGIRGLIVQAISEEAKGILCGSGLRSLAPRADDSHGDARGSAKRPMKSPLRHLADTLPFRPQRKLPRSFKNAAPSPS
jgi:GNAT superfamily N-acetyltransferase